MFDGCMSSSNDDLVPASRPKVELTEADVARLLNDNSAENKIIVLDKITSIYKEEDAEAALDSKEAAVIEDIFRVLVKTAEARVRIAFSESIKNSMNLPKDIALALAKDIDQVALPMLQASQVLNDADLIEIIRSTNSLAHMKAIAQREHVSETISRELVEKDAEVIETLLGNFGAEIGTDTYDQILDKGEGSEVIIRAMVEKGQIPVTVMEKLLNYVKGSIRKELDEKYHVIFESKALKKEMETNLRQATRRMMGMRSSDAQKKKILKQLADTGRLSVFSALTTGNYAMFESDMARYARVSLNNVRILLNDPGEKGLEALYKKAGLPGNLYAATAVLIQTLQMLEAEHFDAQNLRNPFKPAEIIDRMKIVVGERKIDNLDFIVAMIEHNRKWLNSGF